MAPTSNADRRILVVDDDPLILRSVEKVLLRAGYAVSVALDVATATRISSAATFDAALVDYALGRDDGLVVLSKLRESHPSCLRVLMTARSDFPVVVEAINRGEVVRVLRKPFASAALLGLLDDAFASARRMEEVATAKLIANAMHERRALDELMDRRMLSLALQPILEIRNGRAGTTVAYEALMRSSHPTVSSPHSVLELAERYARLGDLGATVFDLSASWLARLPGDLGLFVNVHPDQLGDPERLRRDLRVLEPFARRVTLEITERSRLQDIDRWDESVRVFSDAGFSVAVDDLGAGYSSLTMLADLQPQYIKLDMSLVRNLHREPRKQRLVQLMVTFADATNAKAIAEGVESAEELAALVDCGIHLVQGFLLGVPSAALPVEAQIGG